MGRNQAEGSEGRVVLLRKRIERCRRLDERLNRGMNETPIPTLAEFLEIAPIATTVVLIVAFGFYAGYKSRDDHVETLKSWIEYLKNINSKK